MLPAAPAAIMSGPLSDTPVSLARAGSPNEGTRIATYNIRLGTKIRLSPTAMRSSLRPRLIEAMSHPSQKLEAKRLYHVWR